MGARTALPAVLVPAPDGGLREVGRVHGRTLHGAIDAYVGSLHHTRPGLVAEREAVLGDLAGAWRAAGGANALGALRADAVAAHLGALPPDERGRAADAVRDLMAWARTAGVLDEGEGPPVAA